MEQKIFTNRSGNQELRCLQFTNIIEIRSNRKYLSIDIMYKILHYWLWHYSERIKIFHKPQIQIQIWGIYDLDVSLQFRVFTLCCCLLCKCLKYPSLHASDLLPDIPRHCPHHSQWWYQWWWWWCLCPCPPSRPLNTGSLLTRTTTLSCCRQLR